MQPEGSRKYPSPLQAPLPFRLLPDASASLGFGRIVPESLLFGIPTVHLTHNTAVYAYDVLTVYSSLTWMRLQLESQFIDE